MRTFILKICKDVCDPDTDAVHDKCEGFRFSGHELAVFDDRGLTPTIYEITGFQQIWFGKTQNDPDTTMTVHCKGWKRQN